MSTLQKRFLMIVAMAMVAVVILPGLTRAQQEQKPPAGPDPDQPVAGDILKHIPADAAAFMVTPNFNGALKSIDSFMAATGLAKEAGLEPGSLLPMLAGQMGLGKGYNPNGGIAIIVTNLKASGTNIAMAITDEDPAGLLPPPIVLLAAGKSAEEIFPMFVTEDENGKKQMMIPEMGPAFSKKLGDYVAISASEKALATLGTGKSAAATLSKEDLKILREGNAGLFYNFKALIPEFKAAMKAFKTKAAEQEANQGRGGAAEMALVAEILQVDLEIIEQTDTMALSLRYAKEGIYMNSSVAYVPDSALGKMTAGMIPTRRSTVSRLANMPYVMACGGKMPPKYGQFMSGYMNKMLSAMLKMGGLKIPTEMQTRMVKLTEALGDQVTGMQMVGGGGKTKGLFGTAMVIQCQSATQTKALLKEKASLVTEFLQDVLSAEEKDLKTAKVTYTKGAETIGSVQVDSMEITSEEIKNISPHDRKEMTQVLGEDKLRVLVAEVDPKTLVLSFGGSTETMAQAIQAAQRGGAIASDPGVMAVQKYLPKERVSEMYFSPKNLFSTIQTGMVKMGEKSNLPPTFRFKSNLPIAMSSTVNGPSAATVMFVPTDTIIDIVHWAQEEEKAQKRRYAEMEAKWEAERNATDPMIVEEVEIE